MKCPICRKYCETKKDVILHMDAKHFAEIPSNVSTAKYYFALNHNGEMFGKCRICGDPTDFDEVTGRTKVLCKNPLCKTKFAEIAQGRNMNIYGVPHLLNNQDHQMKMLANRKISGEYEWSDGRGRVAYVGSYEQRFLQFMDTFLGFDPATIYAPCPITIYYQYEGETLSNTPDFYIDILDLIVEIKHGGDNPNTHPKIQSVDVPKDKAKEQAMRETTNHNYIKITDNDFRPFIKLLFQLTENEQAGTKERLFIINESEIVDQTNVLTESGDALDLWIHDVTLDADKMLGKAEPDTLVFHLFGHVSRTFIGAIDITITFKDSFNDMIDFVDNRFIYMDPNDAIELTKTFVASYKYIGELDLTEEMATMKRLIADQTQLTDSSEINAIVRVFSRAFDKKNNYTILDFTINSDFVKYRTIKDSERTSDDPDYDLVGLATR
jgi:hypothetical protein